jgi:hypothetical protein
MIELRGRTESLWSALLASPLTYTNVFYNGFDPSSHDVLLPSTLAARCPLWTDLYMRYNSAWVGEHLYANEKLMFDSDAKGTALLSTLLLPP